MIGQAKNIGQYRECSRGGYRISGKGVGEVRVTVSYQNVAYLCTRA